MPWNKHQESCIEHNVLQIQRSYKASITLCFPLTTYESREVQRIILQDIWDRMYKHRRIRNWILLWSGFRHCRPGDLGENMGITFKWMDSHSKLSRFPACSTNECSQRGEEFKPWLVQGQTLIIVDYWYFSSNELSRTPMHPPCTHESHNQVESLTRDLRRPYEGSEARTLTTLSTLIGVCQQAGSYHNLYVWFVVPDVEVLG